MPYEIKAMAGQQYTPSNGSEGRMFMRRFCDHCIHEDAELEHCPIGFRALAGMEPPEWTHDADGRPTCTQYKALSFDEERARLERREG